MHDSFKMELTTRTQIITTRHELQDDLAITRKVLVGGFVRQPFYFNLALPICMSLS